MIEIREISDRSRWNLIFVRVEKLLIFDSRLKAERMHAVEKMIY